MDVDDTLRAIALAELQQPGDIERVEADDGSVTYRNVLLLAPGVWGDAGTQREFLYSERTTQVLADNIEANALNLFHERENDVVEVGEIPEESVYVGEDDGGLYGDIRLSMENDASRLADDLLQQAFESGGEKGLQGPSLEIRGDEYEFDEASGVHELIDGAIIGAGLVGLGVSPGPGSKDTAFSKQARQRAVALSSTDSATVLTKQNHAQMNTDHIIEQLDERGISVGDDPDEETLRTLAEAFELELQEDEDEEEEESSDEDESDDEEEEDDDPDLSEIAELVERHDEAIGQLAEQVQAIAEATEALQAEDGVDLSELAESVTSLSESVETRVSDLESRLAALEDEPEDPTSLAEGAAWDTTDSSDGRVVVAMGAFDPAKPTFTQ